MEGLVKDILLTISLPILGWMNKNIVPRIIYYHSKEPKIDGKWNTSFKESGVDYTENVELRQKGKYVRGKIELLTNDPKNQRRYSFKGSFKQRILTCTYSSDSPEDYEEGAFVLEYKNDRSFKGEYILFSKDQNLEPIFSTGYVWKK